MDFSNLKPEAVLQELKTNTNGLSKKEAANRLKKYGYNDIIRRDNFWLWKKIFHQFTDLLVILLIIAGSLALIFQDYRDAIVMFIIVLLNAAIGFSQEFKAERILQQLEKLIPKKCTVMRDAKEIEILSKYIVPGDIIVINSGDDVPADARIIEAYSLYIDEASLTGESQPQHKHSGLIARHGITKHNMLYMGTLALEGEARAVITNTGTNTEFGKIAQETRTIKEDLSPLQRKLREVGRTVSAIALIVLILMMGYGYLISKNTLDAFLLALAVAAAVVPEGLPATVSVALSLGAKRLAKSQAVLNKLSAVETLGSVNVICTDKTGTITKGKMTVSDHWDLKDNKIIKWVNINKKNIERTIEIISLCQNVKEDQGKHKGDVNEISLVRAIEDKGISINKVKENYHKISEFSFSSVRKMMSVIYQQNNTNNFYVYTKGLPHKIIEHLRNSVQEKASILKAVDEMSLAGLRVMALAYKKVPKLAKNKLSESFIEHDLEFNCLIGIKDEIRPEVPDAIDLCHKAGINLIMITGDYSLTAMSVAQSVNLSKNQKPRLISGDQLAKMSEIELRENLQHPAIFYQVLPGDKLKIVTNLQKMGKIVAVTGDGINDAPALKKADIGVAMGKIGTDVARDAASMVLLDDNFATIVKAIKEGRLVWDNLKKFLFYVFASNSGELLTVILGLIFFMPLPITAVQILAVDLGTDVLPSLALAADKAEKDIMQRMPRSPRETLLNSLILWRLLYVGLIMGGGAVSVFYILTRSGASYLAATTASYTILVLCQIINAFSIRYPNQPVFYNFFKNRYLIGAEIISLLLLLGIIYYKPLNIFLGTAPFPSWAWGLILIVPIVFWVVEETKKYLVNRKPLGRA